MPKDKLVAVTRVKNEVDIIEPFVRHHARYFDRIIALDDGSTDGTDEVLAKLRSEGAPLVVLSEPSIGYDQRGYMTRLLHMAINQFGADWVAPLDADEFIEPPEATSLAEVLAGREHELRSLGWCNFAWRDDRSGEMNPVVRLDLRLPRQYDFSKVLVPASLVGPDTELLQGNHQLSRGGVALTPVPLDEACLCHFPIRSLEQYASKVAIGYLQYRAYANRRPGDGYHYDEPFRALCSGLDLFASRLEADSLNYSAPPGVVFDAKPRRAPLRYAGGPLTHTPLETKFLANLLGYTETLAELARESDRPSWRR